MYTLTEKGTSGIGSRLMENYFTYLIEVVTLKNRSIGKKVRKD